MDYTQIFIKSLFGYVKLGTFRHTVLDTVSIYTF